MLALASIVFSWALIIALCLGDPKRRRAQRLGSGGQSAAIRRGMAASACLPGLLCALLGDASAFLIWLGGSGLAGWATASWFARPDPARSAGRTRNL